MNKAQALDQFWNGFGIPAWDENTVPEDPAVRGERYITLLPVKVVILYKTSSFLPYLTFIYLLG